MSETDSSPTAMPLIASVDPLDPYKVKVTWSAGLRSGTTDVVDLSPLIDSFRFYKPLRGNADLFRTVHVRDDGNAIAWRSDDELDMSATSIERLAEESRSQVPAFIGAR
jgi:hypothetical protein